MNMLLKPEQRLIVAADFEPSVYHGRAGVKAQVLALADSLKGTGVCLKVNSALRACGYILIEEIKMRGLTVFADLKLNDINATLATDGSFLRTAAPELVTVMCSAGQKGLEALKNELPNTEVLGVTVLTTLGDVDTMAMFDCGAKEAVLRLAGVAAAAKIDGLISSPAEAQMLRSRFGSALSINTPAIRPSWTVVPGDDQNPERIMTPARAIKAGADRIVVGRPIVLAKSPYDAVMRTIEEIATATQ